MLFLHNLIFVYPPLPTPEPTSTNFNHSPSLPLDLSCPDSSLIGGPGSDESSVPQKLLILDARSYTAAVANRAKGGGCECEGQCLHKYLIFPIYSLVKLPLLLGNMVINAACMLQLWIILKANCMKPL